MGRLAVSLAALCAFIVISMAKEAVGHECRAERYFRIIDAILRRHRSVVKAAFSVHSTRTFTARRPGEILPFNVIELNIGKGFHNNVFTCPVSGLYYLSWSYFTNPGNIADLRLVVNGSPRRYTANNAASSKAYPTAANAIIIRLKKRDRVWLNTWGNWGNGRRFVREYATFQGWAIQTM